MLIDFCDYRLQPRMACDTVSADGYEVGNLCTNGFRRQGFMAERFIKPPVSITVQFPCNIDLYKVVINPLVGSQKSVGFEVYTKSEAVKSSWLLSKQEHACKAEADGIFTPVGKVYLRESMTFCFHNFLFRPRPPMSHDDINSFPNYPLTQPLRHHLIKSLSSVSHMTIRITRTTNSCVPCIGRLEIWGQLAVSCQKRLQKKVFDLYCQKPDVNTEGEKPTDNSKMKNRQEDKGATTKNIGNDIPEEFIDLITCNIMSLPVLLPSGKTIDQSTLDTFIENEATWGRPPSDPFTGVRFTSHNKPVLNAALKIRIDNFLLLNAPGLERVPRTLGTARDFHNQLIKVRPSAWAEGQKHADEKAVKQESHNSSVEIQESASSLGQLDHNENTAVAISQRKNLKRHREGTKKTPDTHCKVTNKILKVDPVCAKSSNECLRDMGDECITTIMQASSNAAEHTSLSHEDQLSHSLDTALLDTLSGLPTFRLTCSNMSSTQQRQKAAKGVCGKCEKQGTEAGLYILPCEHILCRTCLVATKDKCQYTCAMCETEHSSKTIKKFYQLNL